MASTSSFLTLRKGDFVYKTTKQVKKQFDAMREQQEQFTQRQEQPTPEKKQGKVDNDDYIEFEEIKN